MTALRGYLLSCKTESNMYGKRVTIVRCMRKRLVLDRLIRDRVSPCRICKRSWGSSKPQKKPGRRDRELQIQNEFLRLVAVQEDIHETFDLDKNIPPLNVKPPFKRELL